jgi:hypothetical protein
VTARWNTGQLPAALGRISRTRSADDRPADVNNQTWGTVREDRATPQGRFLLGPFPWRPPAFAGPALSCPPTARNPGVGDSGLLDPEQTRHLSAAPRRPFPGTNVPRITASSPRAHLPQLAPTTCLAHPCRSDKHQCRDLPDAGRPPRDAPLPLDHSCPGGATQDSRMPAPKHDRRSTHPTPRQRWDFRNGQWGAPVAVDLAEASALHPVLPALFDALPGAPDEVPPHDDPLHRMHPQGCSHPALRPPSRHLAASQNFGDARFSGPQQTASPPGLHGMGNTPSLGSRHEVLTTLAPEPSASPTNTPSDSVSTVRPEGGVRPAAGQPQTFPFASAQAITASPAPTLPGAVLGSVRMHAGHVGHPVTRASNRSVSVPPQPASDRHEPPRSLANPTRSDLQK